MRARSSNPPGAGGSVKKLSIKPLSIKPSLPADFELVTWQKLQAAVRAVHEKRPVESSLEELYRAVEDLCTHKMAAGTYARLQEECERHTERSLRALVAGVSDMSAFLVAMHGVWSDHCQQSLVIRSIFLYLDRTYPLQTPGVRSLWDMGLQHFRACLLALPDVLGKTVSGLLLQVQRERQGEQVDRSLLHHLVRMLSALQIYTERFEGALLERTGAFYAAEAARLLGSSTVGDYLRHAEARLLEEAGRVQAYLHSSTRKPLLAAVHATLLAPHTEALLEKGFDKLVEEARIDDLRRVYVLFGHVDALRLVRDAWAAHVK
ncbi:Cullin repeat-like-containing domain protein, partial [Pavlovales sp. CCMP2436]